jgi:hypothetical protein
MACRGKTMTAPKLESIRSRIETVVALARLLERVEAKPAAIGAEQYRALARQIGELLAEDLPDNVLQAVLGSYPATAELYENLHYAQSGLSRSPLERSIASELLATQALARAARKG